MKGGNDVDDEVEQKSWKQGDQCYAVWAGNGCYYGAVVDEVHHETKSIKVVWDDKETTHQIVPFEQVMEPGEENRAWKTARIEKRASVKQSEFKGRCLFTNKAVQPGGIVFIEKPTLVALPADAPKVWERLTKLHEQKPLQLGTVTFHYAALLSELVLDTQDIAIIMDKYVPDPNEEAGEDVVRILGALTDDLHEKLSVVKLDAKRFQRLVSAWRYNSFGHHKEDGLVLYNRISMCAHSCDPSCCWSYGEDDAFVLRARIDLTAGDELTVSYLQDEDLLRSIAVRRQKLQNWRFTCACERCCLSVDKGRGFRCRTCTLGVMYPNDNNGMEPCSVCNISPSDEDVKTLLKFEEDYVARVDGLDKTDIPDVQTVYEHALEIFDRHWILFVMDTYLWLHYREKKIVADAIEHQQRRIEFHQHYYPRSTFVLAWCHEELGDCLQNHLPHRKWQHVHAYQRAYHMLAILCGASHHYTASPYNKICHATQNGANPNTPPQSS